MTFYVGQKVVCVDDVFHPSGVARGTILPVKGEVYTIRGLMAYSRGPVCWLAELHNAVAYLNEDTGHLVEAAFPVYRFRPLIDSSKSGSFTAGAPKDSEKWDNRKVVSPRHRVRVNG